MRNLLLLASLVLLLIGCKNDSTDSTSLIHLAPENASVIVKTKSIEGLRSVFKNNTLLKDVLLYKENQKIQSQLEILNHLKPSEHTLICFGKNAQDSLQVSIITKYHKDLLLLDSVPNRVVESYTKEDQTIQKTTVDKLVLFSTIKDSIFFASNDQKLVESAFKDDKVVDAELLNIYNSTGDEQSVSIIFKPNAQKLKPSFFFTENLNRSQLASYIMVDGDLSQDQLVFNGIAKAVDSTESLINAFRKTIPQENQVSKICPPDADGFMSFTFGNYRNLWENLSKFKSNESPEASTLFDTASEIGVVYRGNDQAIVVRSLDALAMDDQLLTQNAIETYRDVNIYPFDQPNLFAQQLAPFIDYANASKYANIDDFFVFTESDMLLKDMISSYQNTSGLSETSAFQSVMEQMSDESSLFVYANAQMLNKILNTNFSEEKMLDIGAFKMSAIQFIQDHDFAHVNAIIKKNKGKVNGGQVSEEISVTLDNDLLNNPQLVKNHTNNEMDIVVQDIKNNLYLISNDGKVLWKKQLEGAVLGKVEQIDIYKNGRLQLAFATANRVYVLDRNGKDVGPFPLKFNDNITQPLSVFDYDNKRDYRLMVTQGKQVLLYDKNAKIVTGFTYKRAENSINTQPKHFRIGSKDYIVFVQGSELEIMDRTGKTRVNVKNNIAFSGNEVFVYENKFTATTDKGDLIQIDENGKMSSMNLNLGEKHAMTATSKTLVTLSDNILNIKTHKVEMDFGTYTEPIIFYLNDKIYVAITDLQTKKVYLYDSLGKLIQNFPVYGNSSIHLGNMNNGKGLEFVAKGDSNSVLIYKMD